jgi:hypothetical protein
LNKIFHINPKDQRGHAAIYETSGLGRTPGLQHPERPKQEALIDYALSKMANASK